MNRLGKPVPGIVREIVYESTIHSKILSVKPPIVNSLRYLAWSLIGNLASTIIKEMSDE